MCTKSRLVGCSQWTSGCTDKLWQCSTLGLRPSLQGYSPQMTPHFLLSPPPVWEQNLTLLDFLSKVDHVDRPQKGAVIDPLGEIPNLPQRNRFTNLFSNSDSLKAILPANSCHATDSRNALRLGIKIQVILQHLGRGRFSPTKLKI